MNKHYVYNSNDLINNSCSELTRKSRQLNLETLEEALNSIKPEKLIRDSIKLKKNNNLIIGDTPVNLAKIENIYIVGGGKASGNMALEIASLIGNRLKAGIVNIPKSTKLSYNHSKICFQEADHPIPSESGVDGVRKIIKLVKNAEKNDLIFFLISGGGSALLPMPRQGITLDEKRFITDNLLKAGCRIDELNCIRKHLSGFKGGQFLKQTNAQVISLIISDVVNDRLDVIASGPTSPDITTFSDSKKILIKYDIWNTCSPNIKKVIEDGISGLIPETPKPGDPIFSKVFHKIIGNNRKACLAAKKHLKKKGLNVLFLSSLIEGEARYFGETISSICVELHKSGNPIPKPCAIIAGGETTVTVKGNGTGGRSQEAALSASKKIEGLDGVSLSFIGTDGIDGFTDAAGAIVDGNTIPRSIKLGLNHQAELENNNSYTFFNNLSDLIFTGPTGTNVSDVAVCVIL